MIESPCAYSAITENGTRLTVLIKPSEQGQMIHAEETLDGRVVGRVEISQVAFQRIAGLAQRVGQPENRERDEPLKRIGEETWVKSMFSDRPASLPPC